MTHIFVSQVNGDKVIKEAELTGLKALSGQEDRRAIILNQIKYKLKLEPWRGTIKMYKIDVILDW